MPKRSYCKCFLIVCFEGETGHSRGPSDGAKLQLPGLAKSVLPLPPVALATPNFSEHTVSILYSPCCQVWYQQGGKVGTLSLLRMQPLPSAPTRPALCKRTFSPHHSLSERPRGSGTWKRSMPANTGAPGGQGASGPEEARERGKAVAQHKMRQPSKGQTVWNRLAKEREQKSFSPWPAPC